MSWTSTTLRVRVLVGPVQQGALTCHGHCCHCRQHCVHVQSWDFENFPSVVICNHNTWKIFLSPERLCNNNEGEFDVPHSIPPD